MEKLFKERRREREESLKRRGIWKGGKSGES